MEFVITRASESRRNQDVKYFNSIKELMEFVGKNGPIVICPNREIIIYDAYIE